MVLACGRDFPLPLFHYTFEGDLTSSGGLEVMPGVPVGFSTFVPGAVGQGLALPIGATVSFPGTATALATAPALTFSVRVRGLDGALRNFLACRVDGRGFEAYFARRRVYACAGDADGPPLAWGACANVPAACGADAWAHVVVRWAGAGHEPEIGVDGGPFATLHADGVSIEGLALFDGLIDLAAGIGRGDGTGASGRIEIDELRVYDLALPDDVVWSATGCPR